MALMSGAKTSSSGTSSRSKITVIAAVFVVAVMMAVPVAVSFDSDAGAVPNEIGYSFEMTNPTDQELNDFGVNKQEYTMMMVGEILDKYCNDAIYGVPTVTIGAFSYEESEGDQVKATSQRTIWTRVMQSEDVNIELPVTTAGKIVTTNTNGMKAEDYAIVKAIDGYLGSAAVGDKIVITGYIKLKMAMEETDNYKGLNVAKLVLSENKTVTYASMDCDLTVKLVKSGQTDGKSIDVVVDQSAVMTSTYSYEYQDPVAEITGTTVCFITNDVSEKMSGKAFVKVDGKEYDMADEDAALPDAPEESTAAFSMKEAGEITVSGALQAAINALHQSTDNVTVGMEYSDASSAFSDVKNDVDPEKRSVLPFIIAGVAVVVIIGVAAVVISKKKKKGGPSEPSEPSE